jgi:hypothetical protein
MPNVQSFVVLFHMDGLRVARLGALPQAYTELSRDKCHRT